MQETEGPSYSYQWESSCQSYAQVSEELKSPLRSEIEFRLAVTALRDYVTTEDPCFAYNFVKDVLREERERDEDGREENDKNEGILFKEVIFKWQLKHEAIDM